MLAANLPYNAAVPVCSICSRAPPSPASGLSWCSPRWPTTCPPRRATVPDGVASTHDRQAAASIDPDLPSSVAGLNHMAADVLDRHLQSRGSARAQA
jgi:hypothetical protein